MLLLLRTLAARKLFLNRCRDVIARTVPGLTMQWNRVAAGASISHSHRWLQAVCDIQCNALYVW
jgi:hypothetical protein